MFKKMIAVAATSAALVGGTMAMSVSAEAHPWHGYRHWHRHPVMRVWHPAKHCAWRTVWHHGHRVKVRVCRPIYW